MWEEEIERLEQKGVRKVRTAAGVREYHQPVGTPIVSHPDLPKGPNTLLGAGVLKERIRAGEKATAEARKKVPVPPKKVDKRTTQGQTVSNFVHPVTGHAMGKTETGDTFERLFEAKMRKALESEFGCCLKLITGAGSGTNRTTALDFSLGTPPNGKGGEVKTLSGRSANQKTAIKKEEVARKVAAVTEMNAEPLLIVQVVDQDTGVVRVYAHQAFESKSVKSMLLLGEYKFSAKDFQKAQEAAGHWDKKEQRAKDQAEKATAEGKAWWTYLERKAEDLARLGDAYDPPDEEGGVIEPGDTVIQLKEVDGKQVPFIYTFPDEDDKDQESKAAVRKVRSREGVQYYDRPIGAPITPHPHTPHAPIPSWDLPTTRAPKPLYDGPTRPPHINPRDFDDFLDSIDPRLTERWRNASVPDFWAWVVEQPGEDQARITHATARMLTLMRRKGLGWLIELEGKSAIRHMDEGEVKMDRATVLNEDWIKTRTWDIWLGSRLVKSLPDLKEYCDRQRMSLDQFMSLPAAMAMPEELKAEMDLWKQEWLAGQMDVATESATGPDGDDPIGQLIEKGLFRGHHPKKVRTAAGVREYHAPIGTPIVAHPDAPNMPGASRHGATPTHAASGHRGGEPDAAGGTLHAGHYGKMSVDDWLDGLSKGKYKSWTPVYKAAWLDDAGKVDAVADHNAIPGDKQGAFGSGMIRVALVGWETPEKRVLHFQIQGKAGKKQVETMVSLAKEVGARSITVNVGGNDRGEDEPVNGEFTFATTALMEKFLGDPTKRPSKDDEERQARMSVYAQFKSEEELESKDDITFWDAADLDADTSWDEKAGVRRVQTAAGVARFKQPLHSIIKPDLIPGRVGRAARRLTSPKGGGGGGKHETRTPKTPTEDSGVINALTRALQSAPDRNVRQMKGGKPNKLYLEREARLLTDPAYKEKFDHTFAFISGRLPPPYNELDPTSKNPEYRAYVEDLVRRLSHAMAEPGPFDWDPTADNGDGAPTPEGTRIIERLVRNELLAADKRNVPKGGKPPHVIVAAGVSGSGKTTTLKNQGDQLGIEWGKDENGEDLALNYVVPNPDDLKEKMAGDLPQIYMDLGINPDESAFLTHELSSRANKELLKALRAGGYNIVLDATFEGPMSKRVDEVGKLRAAGYEVTGVLVDGQMQTSLERAAGRHIVVQSLAPRLPNGKIDWKQVHLDQANGIDTYDIPDGGYGGRFVPVVLLAEQLPDDRPILSPEGWDWVRAQAEIQYGRSYDKLDKKEMKALMEAAPGRINRSSWEHTDAATQWLSANAMNFENAIQAGLFDSWKVVDSDQQLVAQGGTGGVPILGGKADEVGAGTGAGTGGGMLEGESKIRYELDGPAGKYPLLEAVADFDEGLTSWDELVAWASTFKLGRMQHVGEMQWVETEDAYPQPGTYDELISAYMSGALTWEQYLELDGVLVDRG